MKKFFIIIAIAICAVCQLIAQNQIAIYVVGDASNSYKKVVASALTQAVNSDGHFQAVERTEDFLGALGNEVSYQNSGAVSQARITELGRQFGAQYVFVVDLNNVLGELYASSRIINVERNIVESASDESSKVSNMDQLRNLANQISTTTLAKLPYNVEIRRQQQQAQDLANLRNFASRYRLKWGLSVETLYNLWRNGSYQNKETSIKIIEARKKLNLQLEYPVIYSIELCEQHAINNGKGMKGTCYKLEYKGIIANGNTISRVAYVNKWQNGATTGSNFTGSGFVRD
ncbi:MAG: hypothetical protein K2L41_08765 [Muribaculaceae bacterium]|nr:hypothetical protein [Muribaculaceae bacterium]